MKIYKGTKNKENRDDRSQPPLYVGIDLHRVTWHVTVRTADAEVFSGGLPGKWEALKKLFDRYPNYHISVVYEAGYFGFWSSDFDRQIATNSVERTLSSFMIELSGMERSVW